MSDTQPRPPTRPPRPEPATTTTERLTPPVTWQHTRQGQLAARLAQAQARRAGQRQLPAGTAGPIGRAYMSAALARLDDPRPPAADPEPEAGA